MSTGRDRALESLLALLGRRLAEAVRRSVRESAEHLEHIPEPGLRGRAFLEELARETPEVAVETLHALEGLASQRLPAAQKLFLALLDEELVREYLTAPALEEIWRLGRLRGYHRMLAAIFYAGPPDRRLEERPSLPPDIRDIPLGRRKSMARSDRIIVLERLLSDTDLSVIRNLLANPRLTEREVVKIAARRPSPPGVLEAVAADRRWVSRYAVKKALVCNPWTPTNIALALIKYLLGPDLAEISRQAAVSDMVRRAARETLQARGR